MSLLYYFDKFTAWLDFSWIVTRPNKAPMYSAVATDLPPTYVCEIGECKPAECKPAEYKPAECKPIENKLNEEEKHIEEKHIEDKHIEEKSK